MTPSILITEVCPYCSRGRSLADLLPWAGTRICTRCYQSHQEAMTALSTGAHPSECSECHLTWEQLCNRAGISSDAPATMDVHNENGLYRFMCRKCSRDYIRKRKELYGPTEFGHRLGLT